MRVYVVIGYLAHEFATVEAALAESYPNATYKAREGVWFLRSDESTTKEVSDKLGFTPSGTRSNGLVIGMNGYFGRWRPDIWEWLNTSQGAPNG